jgi:hypothetical protein
VSDPEWEEDTDEYDEDSDDDGEVVAWICACGEINPVAKATCGDCGASEKDRIA